MACMVGADSVDTGDETGIPIAFHLSGDGKTLFNATFWPTRLLTFLQCPYCMLLHHLQHATKNAFLNVYPV